MCYPLRGHLGIIKRFNGGACHQLGIRSRDGHHVGNIQPSDDGLNAIGIEESLTARAGSNDIQDCRAIDGTECFKNGLRRGCACQPANLDTCWCPRGEGVLELSDHRVYRNVRDVRHDAATRNDELGTDGKRRQLEGAGRKQIGGQATLTCRVERTDEQNRAQCHS
ncbi:MAG: hypothetical protein Rubg2KO_15700 [Rubricoccaceae bacterium]